MGDLPRVQNDGVTAQLSSHNGECFLHGLRFECLDLVHNETFRRERFGPEWVFS
jgi:hypothetical protein